MDSCKFSDLKPSRDLIDPNFGGYKLSLDALPVYSLKLNSGTPAVRCLRVHYISISVQGRLRKRTVKRRNSMHP